MKIALGLLIGSALVLAGAVAAPSAGYDSDIAEQISSTVAVLAGYVFGSAVVIVFICWKESR